MQAKTSHFTSIVFCLFWVFNIAAQNFNWATAAGGIGNDVGTAIATDADGNIYVTGNISGSGYFGNQFVSGTVFEVFLAKYSASGNIIWAKTYGGLKNEKAFSISVTSNAVYLCGYFEGTANFGNTAITSVGGYDVFVMKTDLNGNEIWTKQAGGVNDDIAYGIATDGNENVYVCGNYKTAMNIGNFALNTTNLFNESFLFSLDKNGDFRWAKSSKGNNNNSAFGIAWNKGNGLSVCGFLGSNFSIDSITVASQTSSYDAFVGGFDLNGNLQWLTTTGSAAEDQAMAVVCDNSGNTFITGYIGGTVTNAVASLPFNGWNDVFVSKLNTAGEMLWMRQAGGPKLDLGTGIAIDEKDNVYVTGMFENNIEFNTSQLTDADRGVFLASYTNNGNFRFAQAAGDVQTDAALAVAIKNNSAFLTGYYLFKCKFGNFELPYADFFNIFIASYSIPQVLSINNEKKHQLNIYPNPTSKTLKIETTENTRVAIFNLQATQMLAMEITQLNNTIDLSSLADGCYFVKIEFENGEDLVTKILKQ